MHRLAHVTGRGSRDGLGGRAVILMGRSDVGQCLALLVFGLPGVLDGLDLPGELGHLPLALGQLAGAVAPLPAQQAASEKQRQADQ